MSVALDSVVESQAAQLNLLLYQIYRPYFNGKTCRARGRQWAGAARAWHLSPSLQNEQRSLGNIFRRSF